jgi:hypothetical protein
MLPWWLLFCALYCCLGNNHSCQLQHQASGMQLLLLATLLAAAAAAAAAVGCA